MTAAETRVYELRRLEGVLTSFIARAIAKKEDRLTVLEGINELDDIARSLQEGSISSAKERKLESWLDTHQSWVSDESIRPGDRYRVRMILTDVDNQLSSSHIAGHDGTPLRESVKAWLESATEKTSLNSAKDATRNGKLVLKRPAEFEHSAITSPKKSTSAALATLDRDTLAQFTAHLTALSNLHNDLAGNRLHLISVLDESLQKAERQFHREALHLAAAIIYYLKLQGYLVEPFVQRLKTPERMLKAREEQQKSAPMSQESEMLHASS